MFVSKMAAKMAIKTASKTAGKMANKMTRSPQKNDEDFLDSKSWQKAEVEDDHFSVFGFLKNRMNLKASQTTLVSNFLTDHTKAVKIAGGVSVGALFLVILIVVLTAGGGCVDREYTGLCERRKSIGMCTSKDVLELTNMEWNCRKTCKFCHPDTEQDEIDLTDEDLEPKHNRISTNYLSETVKEEEVACSYTPSPTEDTALTAHNDYRALHKATPALCYAQSGPPYRAQEWSEQMVKDGRMYHSVDTYGRGNYGENLWWSGDGAWDKATAYKRAIKSWYIEIEDWDFGTSSAKSCIDGDGNTVGCMVGHFTALVWVNTQEVRCGMAQSPLAGTFVTCQYNKPGNTWHVGKKLEAFRANVQPLTIQTCSAPHIKDGSVAPSGDTELKETYIVTCNAGFRMDTGYGANGDGVLTCGETRITPICVSGGSVIEGSMLMVMIGLLSGLVANL